MSAMVDLSPMLSWASLTDESSQDSYAPSPAMSGTLYSGDPDINIADQEHQVFLRCIYDTTSDPQYSNFPPAEDCAQDCSQYAEWTEAFASPPEETPFSTAQSTTFYPHFNPESSGPAQGNGYLAPVFLRSQSDSIYASTSSEIHQQHLSHTSWPDPNYPQHPFFDRPSASPSAHSASSSSFNPTIAPTTAENTSSARRTAASSISSSNTPPHHSSTPNLHPYGIPIAPAGPWRCAYPNCTSRALFTRGCDLRKHYNRHTKHLFCRFEGCPQSEAYVHHLPSSSSTKSLSGSLSASSSGPSMSGGAIGQLPGAGTRSVGFSSKKDRARHEAKHNPNIRCEWSNETDEMGEPRGEHTDGDMEMDWDHRTEVCGRVFSRVDNMKDHVRRVHRKGQAGPSAQASAPRAKTGNRSSGTKAGSSSSSNSVRRR